LCGELNKTVPQASNAEPFTGSKRWFERFRKCVNLYNISVQGESASENKGAINFKSMIVGITEEGGYVSQRVF
jgi:hypothetical protein